MIQKQNQEINFASGLDTKTDPKQIPIGKFLALSNSIFTKGGLLQKRNGYAELTALPTPSSYSTTFNGDLTAIDTTVQALPTDYPSWVNKGPIQPVNVSTLPLIRNNLNQTQSDTAISPNGLVCTVYTQTTGSVVTYMYAVADSVTGQNVSAPAILVDAGVDGIPKVFLLGQYFIIVFQGAIGGVNKLYFKAINSNAVSPPGPDTVLVSPITAAATANWDGVVLGNTLYVAFNGAAASGVKMVTLNSSFIPSSAVSIDASHVDTIMSVTADTSTNTVWASYYDSASSTGYSTAVSTLLVPLAGYPTEIITTGTITNITSSAQNGINTIFYETALTVSGVSANFISSVTIPQSTAVVSSPVVVLRSVGLASKSFIVNGVIYVMGVNDCFSSGIIAYQPTYFLINGSISTSAKPVVISKIAYENGGGYYTTGLPSVSVNGTKASVSYLFKDLIEALANANSAGTIVTGGIYSQTGINLVNFDITSNGVVTSEIGSNLNISGGFLWAYDGYAITEQGFHLWPEQVQASFITTGGLITAQQYYYQVVYSWTDNQGNAFRSAPSIPITITPTGSTSTITLIIPTLRITAKVQNAVKIDVYRWSTANQEFYQVGNGGANPITSPLLNDTTIDSVSFVDISADSAIIGNALIYTTGSVIEDIGGPASSIMTLFDDRLWLVDAEDPNLLWFSKQVIESTPVEMSDLLTVYVAPTIGSQGSTGQITALGAMDDKLIIFKENAIYYINGSGPDNTGANSQYSQPVFITATVGCSNPYSIVFIPNGLLFQSDKGIWLLGRDLSTSYLGAPVEQFNSSVVQSSVAIPGTNQVRFTLDTGQTLMYDYFYNQWGTFKDVPAVSSTLYQGLHTFIDQYSRVFQESPGLYLDGSNPVLMSFTTGWLNFAGIQGYQRSYAFYLMGQYITPFKFLIDVAYDYNPAAQQTTTILPTNYVPAYGLPTSVYGSGTPYGGVSAVLNERVFLGKQRCTSFQITLQEAYDPSFGVPAGQGFNLSGLNVLFGIKKGWRTISAANTTGTS